VSRFRIGELQAGDLGLLCFQSVLEWRLLWRNRRSVLFTFLLPVGFLVFIGVSNQGVRLARLGQEAFDVFFVPGILAFGIVSATYANLAISLAVQREQGILKRLRGTPLPTAVLLGGKIGSALVNSLLMVLVVLVLGAAAFHVGIRLGTLGALVLDLVVGTVCWCSLGVAMSCAVTRAQGGSPIVTFPYIVLSFFSGVFYPAELEPRWLQDLARAFPLAPFAESLERCFDPRTAAPGFSGLDVVILLAWTAVGLAVALRWFRFEPRSPSRSGARRDRRRSGRLAPDGR